MAAAADDFFDLPGLEADDTINEEIIAKEESQRKDELLRQTPVIQSVLLTLTLPDSTISFHCSNRCHRSMWVGAMDSDICEI